MLTPRGMAGVEHGADTTSALLDALDALGHAAIVLQEGKETSRNALAIRLGSTQAVRSLVSEDGGPVALNTSHFQP